MFSCHSLSSFSLIFFLSVFLFPSPSLSFALFLFLSLFFFIFWPLFFHLPLFLSLSPFLFLSLFLSFSHFLFITLSSSLNQISNHTQFFNSLFSICQLTISSSDQRCCYFLLPFLSNLSTYIFISHLYSFTYTVISLSFHFLCLFYLSFLLSFLPSSYPPPSFISLCMFLHT